MSTPTDKENLADVIGVLASRLARKVLTTPEPTAAPSSSRTHDETSDQFQVWIDALEGDPQQLPGYTGDDSTNRWDMIGSALAATARFVEPILHALAVVGAGGRTEEVPKKGIRMLTRHVVVLRYGLVDADLFRRAWASAWPDDPPLIFLGDWPDDAHDAMAVFGRR